MRFGFGRNAVKLTHPQAQAAATAQPPIAANDGPLLDAYSQVTGVPTEFVRLP